MWHAIYRPMLQHWCMVIFPFFLSLSISNRKITISLRASRYHPSTIYDFDSDCRSIPFNQSLITSTSFPKHAHCSFVSSFHWQNDRNTISNAVWMIADLQWYYLSVAIRNIANVVVQFIFIILIPMVYYFCCHPLQIFRHMIVSPRSDRTTFNSLTNLECQIAMINKDRNEVMPNGVWHAF